MPEIPDGLTLFLAVWGAGLSTFVILRESWRARPRARVDIEYDLMPGKNPPELALVGRFRNIGREPIYLERAVATSLPGYVAWNFAVDGIDPPEVEGGNNRTVHFPLYIIEDMIKVRGPKFSVDFYDQTGRRYSSGPIELARVNLEKEVHGLGHGFLVQTLPDQSWRGSARMKWHRFLRRLSH